MTLRRVGLGLLVGAILMAPSVGSAAPALVFEPYNGTVLYAEDPDAQWFPASLTKLMTAYVTFQALKAGTNCGSCRGEIGKIVNERRLQAAE